MRSIAAPHLPGGQREIVIRAPMSTDPAPARKIYDRVAAEIGQQAEQGKKVAILCEGDPLFYGSFMYLLQRLAETWPVGVVPGVSSLAACAAALSMPLASRNEVVTIIPAPLDADELARRIQGTARAAIIKVGRHPDKVLRVRSDWELTPRPRYIERARPWDHRSLGLRGREGGGLEHCDMELRLTQGGGPGADGGQVAGVLPGVEADIAFLGLDPAVDHPEFLLHIAGIALDIGAILLDHHGGGQMGIGFADVAEGLGVLDHVGVGVDGSHNPLLNTLVFDWPIIARGGPARNGCGLGFGGNPGHGGGAMG